MRTLEPEAHLSGITAPRARAAPDSVGGAGGARPLPMLRMEGSLAFRVLMLLTVASLGTGVSLFYLHAFSYPIALAVAVVFALGALCAATLDRAAGRHA